MKGFPLFPHSFPPLKGKTLWKAGRIGAPPTLKNTVFHRHTAGTQCLSRTSGQDAPTAGTQCLSRLRRGPRQQTATIVSSAPRGKALQKQMGSLIAHPQGVFRKGRRKSMQDGESLPCGMSRHPSFLYINRNLLANATCFFL